MSDKSFTSDGYCGLFCAACPQYMGTKSGAIKETDPGACKGCKSDVVAKSWCTICNLKSCAREKGHDFCYQCKEYPCSELEEFKTDSDYPYHGEVYSYMETIKQKGLEQWMSQMKKRWSCSSCGTEFDWWTRSCTQCGAATEGYQKPD